MRQVIDCSLLVLLLYLRVIGITTRTSIKSAYAHGVRSQQRRTDQNRADGFAVGRLSSTVVGRTYGRAVAGINLGALKAHPAFGTGSWFDRLTTNGR